MVTPNPAPCLFLSHSGADTEAALELKRRLLESPDARAAGLTVWLDKDDLAAGFGWPTQIEKAINETTTAFAVHLGAKGVVNWVESEVWLALSRAVRSRAIGAAHYPFIPILSRECAGAAALPPFAQHYQGVQDPLNNPEEFAKLLRAVLGKSPGDKAVALENPFVGLKSMTEADADRFFGRNEEIAGLVEKLRLHRLIAVVADSGAGKSSLAQAGLIPAFRGGRLSDISGRKPDDKLWHVVVMRPGRNPIEGLKRAVTEAAERLGCSADQCARLRKRVDLADPSETAYAIRCDLPVAKTETLLIVDQFEELLTETAKAARAPFVDFLIALAADGGFRIVLTLRADHFNLCRPLLNLFEHLTRNNLDAVLRLGRISDLGIAEAVLKPLTLAGHTDLAEQDAVISSIRRDISDRPGDLALVQMALYAMWQKHKADGADLLVAYAQVGGVAGALAHEAENVRANRLDAAERELLAPVFIRLVRLGDTGGASRRVADFADFDPPSRALVAKLATEHCGRLVLAGETSVEIAHEALITQWPWLQNTLQQVAPDMRVLDRLMDKTRRWVATGSGKAEHLATGAEREEFAALAGRRSGWLSGAERAFVAASSRAHRWSTIGRYAAVAVLAVFAVGAASAAFMAFSARQALVEALHEAVTERNQAQMTQSLFLADLSRQQREADPGTAVLLALEALPDTAAGVTRPYAPEAELQLDRAWRALRERLVLKGHNKAVWSAAFSPDGKRIVTAAEDQTARLWDAESGKQIGEPLRGHAAPVWSAAFSPDGKRIVTASADGTARLWDVESGRQIGAPLLGHAAVVQSAAFSPDGKRIVTASWDRTARLWDAASGKQIGEPLTGHTYFVKSAAFSPDGKRIVTASADGTARLWDVESGRQIGEPLLGHTAVVQSAAFSPDGKRIVTASWDGTARLWDAESGKQIGEPLTGHTHFVQSASFSPDGKRIVTASWDRTARLWDAESGKQIGEPLTGHTHFVSSAAFNPDGRRIVTASNDYTARLWDVESGKPVGEPLAGHTHFVQSASFSPDGKRIVTASMDETARLWDAESGKQIGEPLTGHTYFVKSAAFSPDGKRIVTASWDGTARLWDAESGRQIGAPLTGHAAPVQSASFSPDGKRIVTASADRTARLWDAGSGKQIGEPLTGHTNVVQSASFSSDGKRIVTASADRTARLWDAGSGKRIGEPLWGHASTVSSAAFSPDGKRIVTASWDRTARLWDAGSGKQIGEPLTGHIGYVSSAAFSPDGKRIVTASWDRTARLWDAGSGKQIGEPLMGHTATVWSAAFSPDGKRIVIASDDKTAWLLRVFPVTEEIVAVAKAASPRCLTTEQRRQFFLPAEPPAWCIELEKWPHNTPAWKQWLGDSRTNKALPLPPAP